jgi:hypothetical protein
MMATSMVRAARRSESAASERGEGSDGAGRPGAGPPGAALIARGRHQASQSAPGGRILDEVTTAGGEQRRETVVVPGSPGPLVWLDADHPRRGRDDLDSLIDDLFPEVDERPGWFDVGLVVLGAALLTWTVLGHGPAILLVAGLLALGLGCTLPLRTAWRRAGYRRQQSRRKARLAQGASIDASSPSTLRLVRAYEHLLETGDGQSADADAVAAAHGAVLEAATLLHGRPPAPGRERDYVEHRAAAIEGLAQALGERRPEVAPPEPEGPNGLDPGALVEARDELDEIAGFNSVSRLEELAQDVRMRRHGPA